jgi:antitoxin component YwqK of YwqJK toxin-antitoxin module
LLDDLNYENGKLHGSAKYYNIEGKLIYWGAYENDEKIGKWEFLENGKPLDSIKAN